MPTLKASTPKYRKHRASGQAVVTLSGKDLYLGPHGTKTSRIEYDRVVAEWLQSGRCLPATDAELTVVELLAAYKRYAEGYYRKNGKPTSEVGCVLEAVRYVKELYGHRRSRRSTCSGGKKIKTVQDGPRRSRRSTCSGGNLGFPYGLPYRLSSAGCSSGGDRGVVSADEWKTSLGNVDRDGRGGDEEPRDASG